MIDTSLLKRIKRLANSELQTKISSLTSLIYESFSDNNLDMREELSYLLEERTRRGLGLRVKGVR